MNRELILFEDILVFMFLLLTVELFCELLRLSHRFHSGKLLWCFLTESSIGCWSMMGIRIPLGSILRYSMYFLRIIVREGSDWLTATRKNHLIEDLFSCCKWIECSRIFYNVIFLTVEFVCSSLEHLNLVTTLLEVHWRKKSMLV